MKKLLCQLANIFINLLLKTIFILFQDKLDIHFHSYPSFRVNLKLIAGSGESCGLFLARHLECARWISTDFMFLVYHHENGLHMNEIMHDNHLVMSLINQ